MHHRRSWLSTAPSDVAYGHADNGHGKFRGQATSTDTLRALLAGLAENSWLKNCPAILSGYLGSADQADFVAEAVALVMMSANPQALYLCDPLFGDDGDACAKPGVAEAAARHVVPLAHIVAPNRSVPFGATEIGSHVVTRHAALVRHLGTMTPKSANSKIQKVVVRGERGELRTTESGSNRAGAVRAIASARGADLGAKALGHVALQWGLCYHPAAVLTGVGARSRPAQTFFESMA